MDDILETYCKDIQNQASRTVDENMAGYVCSISELILRNKIILVTRSSLYQDHPRKKIILILYSMMDRSIYSGSQHR